MAQAKIKKQLSDHLIKNNYSSRNNSPTAQIIKASLISSLKQYTKSVISSNLSKQDLYNLLFTLQFLPSKKPSCSDEEEINYMWTLISSASKAKLSDAICYLLCILDLKIPNSVLNSAIVFKELNRDNYTYIKPNSLGLLKNYLESIYLKSIKQNFCVFSEKNNNPDCPFLILKPRTKTPAANSRIGTPKLLEYKTKTSTSGKTSPRISKKEIKTSEVRLKRSETSHRACRSFSKDKKTKSPVIGIEVSTTNGKTNKLTLYKEDLKKKVCIKINL